jgi:endonuclease YncB( thermonuclease family)
MIPNRILPICRHVKTPMRIRNNKLPNVATSSDTTRYRGAICWLIVIVTLPSWPAFSQTLTGQASVIDGDTLELHGLRIRLSCIDAPESAQQCRDVDSDLYQCGAKAANALDDDIAGRPVSCEDVGKDQYGRTVAVYSIDGEDIATWLVRAGLAFDWPRYSRGKYTAAQKEAERAGRGVWAGSYVVPWAYRACIRAGGRPSGCSDDIQVH